MVLGLSCSAPARPPRPAGAEPGSLAAADLRAVRVPILELPVAVDDSGDRVLVGAVRAERSASGWTVSDEAAGGWIVAAARDGSGWIFVSWVGEVVRSETFTGPARQVGKIPAFVERQPSAGRLTILGDDLRLYVADGGGGIGALESLGQRAIVGAVFDRPVHGLALDLGGQILETPDGARTWTPRVLPAGQAPEAILAQAAERVAGGPPPIPEGDAAAILAAVLARTGPLAAYGDGFVEALAGGQSAIRLPEGRFVVVDAEGAAHPIAAPCPETAREGPTLVSRCEDRAHVLDLARREWVALRPGWEPHVSPSGRTIVAGSGCTPDDPLEVVDATTGARRTLPTECIRLDAVTDSSGFARPEADGPIVRLDLASGAQARVTLPERDDRWETGWNGDGTLFASLRDSDYRVPHPTSLTLVAADGTTESTSLPPGTSSFDFDGTLGLAAGDTEVAARTTQALWATADRGRTWMPVDLPEGALLQYPHCGDGACFAGNVRVSRADVPAMPTRQSSLDSPMPRMPSLRCSTEAAPEATADTQVVETTNATVHFQVGRDEQVTVRWTLASSGAEATATGRIRNLVGDDETGAYRFLLSAVTAELVLFSVRLSDRDGALYLAKRGGGLGPAPRGTTAPTAFGTDLAGGEWVWVEGDALRTLARDGRPGPSIALRGRPASGWAIVDGVAAPAIVVGLTPAFPIYAQLPTGTRRFAVRDGPLRGCRPGATGVRVGLLDSETEVEGANGTLMTELLIAPDGAACIARLSNPGAAGDGIARLVATAPDRFEGIVLRDGAAHAAECRMEGR